MARLWELALRKKLLVITSCTLSVLSVAVSFTPFIAVYYLIRELVGSFAAPGSLDGAAMIRLGWIACGGAVAAVFLNFIALLCSHVAAFTTYRDFKRAVGAVALTNLSLLLPFIVIIQTIITLLNPLLGGGAPGGVDLDRNRLWLLLGLGLAAAALYFLAYRNEYRKTYTVAYGESEKIRLEVAEHIRRLPLSFFNHKDLSELTTNMMADCTSIEHTMSHVVPGLFANLITIVFTCGLLALYDWRMSLALFVALPTALGLILGSRKLQALFGERHVAAKLSVSGQVQEYLEGIKVVKAFGLSGEKSAALEQSLRTMMREAIKFEGFTGTFITLAMMVLTGVFLLTGGRLGLIPFLTFIVISAKIYSP
jgi:ATP-binding cassette subfamily B protein